MAYPVNVTPVEATEWVSGAKRIGGLDLTHPARHVLHSWRNLAAAPA